MPRPPRCVQCGETGHHAHLTCGEERPHLSHTHKISQTYLCVGVGSGVVLSMSGEELHRFVSEGRARVEELEDSLIKAENSLHRLTDEVRRRASKWERTKGESA